MHGADTGRGFTRPRASRVPPILALICAMMLAGELVRRAARDHTTRPPADAFRRYTEDPGSRMVVYSPGAGQSDSQLHAQMSKLRERFDGLVLYTCDDTAERILSTAVAMRYRGVLLTVWDPTSAAELRNAATLANAYQGQVALAVSLGSEGLLQERYSEADLQASAHKLEQDMSGANRLEITTTEPWWMYLHDDPRGKGLRSFGDFLTPNIHVVWDTDITDPIEAAHWTLARANELRMATRRSVLVREAGMPGGGTSPRAGGRHTFSRDEQAQFWRALRDAQAALQGQSYIPVVTFEGIDNEAKTWSSFEASWGVLDHNLQPYPAWFVFPLLRAEGPLQK